MHVLEPQELAKRQLERSERRKRRTRFATGTVFVGIAFLGITLWQVLKRVGPTPQTDTTSQSSQSTENTSRLDSEKAKLKIFKGDEFRDLYRSINYPNTQPFSQPPEITGNTQADVRIRKLAEARGFILTSVPVVPIVKTNEPLLVGEKDDLLQPLAYKAWQDLKAAAKKANIPLTLISAYRSPQWQRDLFIERLLAHNITVSQVATGQADSAVIDTLHMTAVPGYSRHHTGYTVDAWCDDNSGNFADSSCYQWLKANNYQHAKENGWIPSYPEDASIQGPEPEPWEYVWVGTDVLYK